MRSEHIKSLFAAGRKETDGRGNVNLYNGHACSHYKEIPLREADAALQILARIRIKGYKDDISPAEMTQVEKLWNTVAMREAERIFVGYGMGKDGDVWIAVCHNSHCYPHHWPDARIRGCEVFVHHIVNHDGPITTYTTPGPQAHCRKMCYKRTAHFFDVEVWSGGPRGRAYQVVLRCEACHHGWDLVTPDSPSRWKRLMKDPVARELLTGAKPEGVLGLLTDDERRQVGHSD